MNIECKWRLGRGGSAVLEASNGFVLARCGSVKGFRDERLYHFAKVVGTGSSRCYLTQGAAMRSAERKLGVKVEAA